MCIRDRPTASTHGIPRQAAVQRKDPRQCLRRGGGHAIYRGSCRGTSVSCNGWYHGDCLGQNRGTCHGHNRGTCRGSAMYNGKPWPLPWEPADFHGSPWQHQRKTTDVPRSLPRTSTKSHIMYIRALKALWSRSIQIKYKASRLSGSRVGVTCPADSQLTAPRDIQPNFFETPI